MPVYLQEEEFNKQDMKEIGKTILDRLISFSQELYSIKHIYGNFASSVNSFPSTYV